MGNQEGKSNKSKEADLGGRAAGDANVNSSSSIRISQLEKLKCVYTNMDGISNKGDIFKYFVGTEKPHIIMISETKLSVQSVFGIF